VSRNGCVFSGSSEVLSRVTLTLAILSGSAVRMCLKLRNGNAGSSGQVCR